MDIADRLHLVHGGIHHLQPGCGLDVLSVIFTEVKDRPYTIVRKIHRQDANTKNEAATRAAQFSR